MNSDKWTPVPRLLALCTAVVCVGCAPSFSVPAAPPVTEIPRLEARVAQDSTDMSSALRLAQAYRAAKRPDAARPLLERALTRHPGEATASFLLGLTYEELGLWSDARRLYRAYIDNGRSGELRDQLTRRMPLLQRRELEAQVKNALAREAQAANTPPQPWTVAVLPYDFVGTDAQFKPLGRALAQLLVNDLSQTARIKVLERAHVQLLLDEMRMAEQGIVDPATAARSGRILGAERVVHGSIDGGEPGLRLETNIVRVSQSAWPGETAPAADRPGLLQLSESDALRELFAMQKRLALRIYASLGVELTIAERERVTQRPTENMVALLSYGRGLEAEDGGDFAGASRFFAEAAALDPSFSEARTSAERNTATAAAADVDTGQLAARAENDANGAAVADEFIVPAAASRDPAAEILRTEGVASMTILELIFRRN